MRAKKNSNELVASILANGSLNFDWMQSETEDENKPKHKFEKKLYKAYQENISKALFILGFADEKISLSTSVEFWKSFAKLFIGEILHITDIESKRKDIHIAFPEKQMEELIEGAPFLIGMQYLDDALIHFLWARLNSWLKKELSEFEGTVEEFIKRYSNDVHIAGKVYFHLVENRKSEEHPFAFLATYSSTNENEIKHLPLQYALEEYDNNDDGLLELLATVELASETSKFIFDLLDSGEIFYPLSFSSKEAFTFLKEIPLYEKAGILCRIPNWWKRRSNAVKIKLSVGDQKPKYLDTESILDFSAKLLLGDTVITEQEAQKILEQSEGLAYIKGKWIEVNREKLEEILTAFQKAQKLIKKEHLSLKEAMQIQLQTEKMLGLQKDSADLIETTTGKWLEKTIEKLKNPKLIKNKQPGKKFKAKLRIYQQEGLNWLHFLDSLQFGACLADDMGLGKTIQVLAFLSNLQQTKKASTNLLVVPASLLANWQKEIERFCPTLKYYIVHPSYNKIDKKHQTKKHISAQDVIITTYTLVQKYDWLLTYNWHYVILDEAQAIKNPATKQARAVKKLKSYNRIIMTGTPIENKLGDLWSLYDFINPGLLGSSKEFKTFSKGLKNRSQGYANLKKVITPYMLRRLKTDKTIISDLPDKIEMKVYANPSKKQILLYEKLVKDIEEGLEFAEGIQRKGLIISSIVKFKQICNHPGQYLENKEFLEKDSGKFMRLREICETILEKREKVLIFTQFKEITLVLHDFLSKIFGKQGLVLHGSTSVKKRKQFIERFQGKEYIPFFILSIKAGGVGLNLTEANHVIHFDRWWNPAVENQATDRAFRIGQKRKVIVHKFITKGTIEEKIDTIIEDKLSLSKEIMKDSNTKWMTELSNNEVIDLFKLTL